MTERNGVRKGPMAAAYTRSVKRAKLAPEHHVLWALGLRYATQMDLVDPDYKYAGREVARLGAALVSVLKELNLTPQTIKNPVPTDQPATQGQPKSKLQQQRDELAAKRAKRTAS